MEDDDGAMEVVPVIAPTGEQAEHTRPGLSGTQADGSTGEERDPRPGVATGRSASVHTLSDISIRIVQCDYKLTRVREVPSVMLAENPDLPLRQPMPGQPGKTREAEVPVIRIFGPVRGSSMTSSGKPVWRERTACAYIHGVFPYFYVKSVEGERPITELLQPEEYSTYSQYTLGGKIDQAVAMSLGKTSATMDDGAVAGGARAFNPCDAPQRNVLRIEAVRRTNFYGYHSEKENFLKITLVTPTHRHRIARILREGGTVLRFCCEAYEVHVPYLQQFFIDNDLAGMSVMHLGSAEVRSGEEKKSTCGIEVDVVGRECIRNSEMAQTLRSQPMSQCKLDTPSNAGLADIWRAERDRYIRNQGKVPDDFGIEWIGYPPPERTYCRPGPEGLDPGPAKPECSGASGRHYCEPTMNERKGAELIAAAIANDAEAVEYARARESEDRSRDIDSTSASQLVDDDEAWAASQMMSMGTQGESQTTTDCIELLAGLAATQDDDNDGDDHDEDIWSRATQVLEEDDKKDLELEAIQEEHDDLMEDGSEATLSQLPASPLVMSPSVRRQPELPGIPETPPSDLPAMEISASASPLPSRNATAPTPSLSQADAGGASEAEIYSEIFSSSWDSSQRDGALRRSCGRGFENDITFNLLYDSDDVDSTGDESMELDAVTSPIRRRVPPVTPGSRSTTRRLMAGSTSPRKRLRHSVEMKFRLKPPSTEELVAVLHERQVPEVCHVQPHYSDPADLTGAGARHFRGSNAAVFSPRYLTDISRVLGTERTCEAPHICETHQNGKVYFTPIQPPPAPSGLRGTSVKSDEMEPVERDAEPVDPLRDVRGNAAGHVPEPPKHQGRQGQTQGATYNFQHPTAFMGSHTDNDAVQYVTLFCAEMLAVCGIKSDDEMKACGLDPTVPRIPKVLPESAFDPVVCVCYCVYRDDQGLEQLERGTVWVDDVEPATGHGSSTTGDAGPATNDASAPLNSRGRWLTSHLVGEVTRVNSEEDLLRWLANKVRATDPDFLLGWELEKESWGYLLQRGEKLGIHPEKSSYAMELSRMPGDRMPRENPMAEYFNAMSTDLVIPGRVVLNGWRLLNKELPPLTQYDFHSVAYHVLHKRIPQFSHHQLWQWWESDKSMTPLRRHQAVHCCIERAVATVQMYLELNLLNRTSEYARLYGCLFQEVLTRGSQFRVESLMLRLGHVDPSEFVAFSPGPDDIRNMRPIDAVPLIIEPGNELGSFFADPVVVLDFQSLYPSVMIAFNYCYSTCLGNTYVKPEFAPPIPEGRMSPATGCGTLHLPVGTLSSIGSAKMTASPLRQTSKSMTMFCKKEVRRGILGKMLTELLQTRAMVKKSMKSNKMTPTLSALLDARQCALKLIANVTYGYTAASMSGRMPSVDISDSIVTKAREVLERSMSVVKDKWADYGADVVYGDTDSMFVRLPGASKETAFRVGKEIANYITTLFPEPIKLKFEKVYMGCILQTKKRYTGLMFEREDDLVGSIESKGTEVIRRDTVPITGKLLKKTLDIFFRTRDLSKVKAYLHERWLKMEQGEDLNPADFTFAREFRGRAGYKAPMSIPAIVISDRLIRKGAGDGATPLVRERYPYVIRKDPNDNRPAREQKHIRILDMVAHPVELAADGGQLNVTYYITRQIIPALKRCFDLVDNVNHTGMKLIDQWYFERQVYNRADPDAFGTKTSFNGQQHITQHFASRHCYVCGALHVEAGRSLICRVCKTRPGATAIGAMQLLRERAARVALFQRICSQCAHASHLGPAGAEVTCIASACPVFYERSAAERAAEAKQTAMLESIVHEATRFQVTDSSLDW